jgi:hypothetical protein
MGFAGMYKSWDRWIYKMLIGKSQWKRPVGISSQTWENNNNKYYNEEPFLSGSR